MVGLGWYLDVFGSESQVLVWVFEDFFEKNLKKKENGNLGKTGPFAAATGTLAAAKGCLAAAKSKGQKGLPSGSPRRSPAMPRRSASPQRSSATSWRRHCSHEKIFEFLFRKSRMCTLIV